MHLLNLLNIPLLLAITTSALAQVDVMPTLIVSKSTFVTDGVIEMKEVKLLQTTVVHKIESGTLNSVLYSFLYTDGSGTFSGIKGNIDNFKNPLGTNWSTACSKDPVTDRKKCYLHLKDLFVYVFPKGGVTVSVGREHFSGSTVALRIDQAAPMVAFGKDDGDFSRQTSSRIISQISTAKLITTRYMKWPYKTWIDETWEPYGFNEAYKYITWAVERIQ